MKLFMYTKECMDLWRKQIEEATPQTIDHVVEDIENDMEAVGLLEGYDRQQILTIKNLAMARGAKQSSFKELLEKGNMSNTSSS